MIKRLFDVLLSLFGLVILSPVLLIVMFLVWRQDNKSPLYIALRSGKQKKEFKIVKLRSMVVNADKNGVDSTSSSDIRITPIGYFIRKYKLDELTQLWNVLIGDMSLVGPRPNTNSEIELYTHLEKKLLSVRPGITDFSSIVFSDEGEILKDKKNPNLSYNQLIRPWKSRLGLIYIEKQSLFLDLKIIIYTVVAIISKQKALDWVSSELESFNTEKNIVNISRREVDLYPFPPPGADNIVHSR
jgi:lipopolysaccharide/colanic/teichoic acid biosynthesis glycosyltransferase